MSNGYQTMVRPLPAADTESTRVVRGRNRMAQMVKGRTKLLRLNEGSQASHRPSSGPDAVGDGKKMRQLGKCFIMFDDGWQIRRSSHTAKTLSCFRSSVFRLLFPLRLRVQSIMEFHSHNQRATSASQLVILIVNCAINKLHGNCKSRFRLSSTIRL